MIAIVNKGPHTDDHGGERTYELRINSEVVGTFKHCRRDGLSACLRAAAKCAERADRKRMEEFFIGGCEA